MASGDIKWVYGTPAEFSWTSGGPTSLSNNTFTSLSDELDVDALDAIDLLIGVKFTPSSTPSTGGFVRIWAAAPIDATNYSSQSENWIQVGFAVQAVGTGAHYVGQFALAEAFGGVLPAKVKLAIENQTGVALSGTADENELWYQAVHANVTP